MIINTAHPDYVELRARIRENPKDFICMVGAGLSVPAGIPDWLGLKFAIIDDVLKRLPGLPDEERENFRKNLESVVDIRDLWQSFSKLKEILDKNAYEQSIKSNLTIKERRNIPNSYDLLWKLGVKGVIDFNLDTCALDSFSKVKKFAVDYATHQDVSHYKQFIGGTQDFVFHPHGIINDPETWVFTEEERRKLLSKNEYLGFMSTVFRAKNVLILGFDPADFTFEYIFQHASFEGEDTGVKHYIFMANPNLDLVKRLGNIKIGVIPYSPEDVKLHKEVELFLKDILDFIPKDVDAASVFSGKALKLEELPPDEELQIRQVENIRNMLNGVISSIIPRDKDITQADYDKIGEFYRDYLFSLNKAWIVQEKSKSEMLYGRKVKSVIGRGAFGKVFLAEDTDNKAVAVKVLLPEVRNDQDYLRSFRRGIRSMRILTERNVSGMVKFIEAYEIPACVFMEYVEGPNLTEAVDSRLIKELRDCLEILVQVGNIVHKAHNLEEHVLHRDLKPANVTLQNFYINNTIDVVVLDFDLSWHKGASELSVVHGARAQGYAAPEQTATGRGKGVSSRHTAVDVFGYGMLAYFVLTGSDPRPNEQNFERFRENIERSLVQRFHPDWVHIPRYLSEIIEGSTKDEQGQRIPFLSAVEAFRNCRELVEKNAVKIYNPSIMLELAMRISTDDTFESSEFGRTMKILTFGGTKTTELSLKDDIDGQVYVAISLTRVTSEYDHRRVGEHINQAKEKAMAQIKRDNKLTNSNYGIGRGRLTITTEWRPPIDVPLSEIIKVAEIIRTTRTCMEF